MKKLFILLFGFVTLAAMQPIPVPGKSGNMEPKKGEWTQVSHQKLEAPNPTRDRLVKERDELERQARFHRETPSKVGKRELLKIEKRIADIDRQLEGRK